MRAVVQRVRSASVSVGGEVPPGRRGRDGEPRRRRGGGGTGRIGAGLLAFIGVARTDEPRDVEYIGNKLCDLRIFADDEGRMNRSVIDVGGSLLVVSQFTLLADCRKGRRPSFDAAAPPALAEALYDDLVRHVRDRGLTVETGVFQAHMEVALVNDGPVTMLLDSRGGF